MPTDSWFIGAVGDVFLDRQDTSDAFAPAMPVLRELDLLIGNCEGAFTTNPEYSPSSTWRVVSDPRNAEAFGPAGFHVMTCANNHTMDAGYRGLDDTLATLKRQNILAPGAGENIVEAERPVTIERHFGNRTLLHACAPASLGRRRSDGAAGDGTHPLGSQLIKKPATPSPRYPASTQGPKIKPHARS